MTVLHSSAESTETAYLYAVVPGDCPELDAPLRVIRQGALAAVISPPPVDFLELATELHRPEVDPRALAGLEPALRAHEEVVESLATEALVPLRFGTTLRSSLDVSSFLERNAEVLTETLQRVAGQAEWSVRLWADGGSQGAQKSPGGAPSSGRDYLEQRRDERTRRAEARRSRGLAAEQITGRLAPVVSEVVEPGGASGETEGGRHLILHLVCLVPSIDEGRFLEMLDSAVAELVPGSRAEVTGPFPPYHFVSPLEPADPKGGDR